LRGTINVPLFFMAIGNSKLHHLLNVSHETLDIDNLWNELRTSEDFNHFLENLLIKQHKEEKVGSSGFAVGFYSEKTEQINPSKKAGTPYTLDDTGDFHKGVFADFDNTEFVMDSLGVDKKQTIKVSDFYGNVFNETFEENLVEKFGEQILGFTDKNKEIIKNYVKEFVYKKVKEILHIIK
jgi:hypothetical protein